MPPLFIRLLSIFLSLSLVLAASLSERDPGKCPEGEPEEIDKDGFFHDRLHVRWDYHHVGWAVAGAAALVATSCGFTNIYLHCTNYTKPLEQRQIVRILLMAPFYAIISFFAFRYYREYVYFGVMRDCGEAFVIASFLILCLLYVGRSPLEQHLVMAQKEKHKLMFPFCCWHYRPSKPYFLFAVKWSVMQYVVLRPLISITSIITEIFGAFCAVSYNYRFANVWLTAITFISVSVAVYGLMILYHLAKEDLAGHRPMAKFLSIKIAVFLVFYQTFLFALLEHFGVINSTRSWTSSNVADGLNALCVTIEMMLVAIFQLYAFSYREYAILLKGSGPDRTPFWSSLAHSQDYRDFAQDTITSTRFLLDKWRGKPYTRSPSLLAKGHQLDFQSAFGMSELRDSGHRQDQIIMPAQATPRLQDERYSDDSLPRQEFKAKSPARYARVESI